MERKQDMKKRGLKSPDKADAIGLTFYPLNPQKEQARKIKTARSNKRNVPEYARRAGVR